MSRIKKSTTKWILAILVVLLATNGLATPMTVSAAAPAAIPSQITLAIGGGAATGKTAMAFNWLTDPTINASEIVYGTSPDLTGAATKSATVATVNTSTVAGSVPSDKLVNVKEVRTYRVVVQDLTPESKYYYKVGNATNGYSAISSFNAPADPAAKKPFSFIVTPDTQGTSPSTYQNTADLYDYIKANHSDAAFLVHNGDVVEDASFSDHWQYFFDAAQNLSSTMPIMATPGNHDNSIYDQDSIQYTNRFNYSSLKRPSGLSSAAVGTVYSFEYGDALFISLNSFGLNSSDDAVQWKFLADEAAASTKQWKIVDLHASPYDPGASHYAVDNVIGKKFTDAGIDLVLAGHEHAYARTTLKTISSASGTGSIQKAKFGEAPTYVIGGSVYNYAYSLNGTKDTTWNDFFYDLRINKTGTGGGSIYSPGVYSRAEVTSNSIIYKTYYKATGSANPFRVIDEFTIFKSGDEITQPIGGGTAPTSMTFMFDNFNEETRKPEKDKYIARFNWVTPVTTKTTQLYYAKKSEFDSNGHKFTDFVMGTNFTVDLRSNIENLKYTGAGTQYSVDPVQSHKAQTAVLEPDTEYVYSVGDGIKNVTSVTAPASFKTPASNIDTFNFNWISDAQANSTQGYAATLNSYKSMSKKALDQAFTDFPNAAFVVSSGDQVNFGFDTWEWDAFFEANQSLFSSTPLYMATGNHEFDGAGNSWANNSWTPVDPTLQNFLGRHNPPKNGASFYGGGDGTKSMVSGMTKLQLESSNYYYVYGDTLFLVMDYQDQSTSAQIKAQQDWMKAVVKQNPTKWRVGMFHKTLFGYRMATPVSSWTDAFDAAGIDVVLMGHDHIYARTKLFASGKVVADYGDGTTYLTNYSANKDNRGALYTGNTAIAYIDIREVGRGYANISISPTQIKVTSKGFDKSDVLQTGDVDVLVTNKPRTYDLQAWNYPEEPQVVNEFTITNIAVNGIAKEGQTLNASITPTSATASFKWESSKDGIAWTAIAGVTAAAYVIKAADVGSYLRAVATGTGFYNGVVTSTATAKVTPLAGNSSAKIKIKTASDLVALSQKFGTPEYPVDGNYELSADIDMKDVEFTSIGRATVPQQFIGTFNGKGYTIRNLKSSSSDTSTGFFAYIGTGGRVVNMNLANVDISGLNRTGIIAGVSSGTIENSYVEGKVTGTGYTGGIVGLLYAGTLQNTVMDATVSGTTVGGLIGGTNYNGSGWSLTQQPAVGNVILNNDVRGTVTRIGVTDYTGGIIGDMGGSSGSLLKTFNGNAVSSEVINHDKKLLAGYWSGSRPIADSNQVNYYESTKLNTTGIPSGTIPAFVAKSTADFALQATYTALGWDFTDIWKWDTTKNVPVPRVLDLGGAPEKIKIKTASDLVALSQNFGSAEYPLDGNYEVSADIDMKDVEFATIGGNDTSKPFIGTFNGKGYTISNLKISTSKNSTGFFAYIGEGGKVVNLKLTNVDITGGNSTGAIAGASLLGTIENSYVDGKVKGGNYTGGIVGTFHAATLKNNFVLAEVTGTTAGGLIGGTGWNGGGSPITLRYELSPTVILNNYVGGTFDKVGTYSGALVGDMGGSAGNLLQTLTGNVIANSIVGSTPPGPIAGYWSSSRPIVDTNQVNNYDSTKLKTTGIPSGTIPAFVAKSTADFALQATYTALGWDFTDIWKWDTTKNVPVPRALKLGDEEEEDNFLTIIASAGAGGKITPEGNVLVERGQSQKFTFTPNQYYEINSVKVDNVVNDAAAAAGEYMFDNVTAVHNIQVTFKLSDPSANIAPSMISTSAYYNRAAPKNIEVKIDFGKGALGIDPKYYEYAVAGVKFMKDGKMVLDGDGSYWFPGHEDDSYEINVLQICYDDFMFFNNYDDLVPGTYDLVITFADTNSTVATISLLVEDKAVVDDGTISALTVDGGTVDVGGVAVESSAQVKEDSQVKVTAIVPEGQRFVKWTAVGLTDESYTDNPFTFTMPAREVTLKAEYESITTTTFNAWTLGSLNRAQKTSAAGTQKNAEVYAGKGETTSFQIVLKAPDNKVLDITDLRMSNLTGPNSSVIPSSNIDLYREHFIKVENHSEPYGDKDTNVRLEDDWFPDALIPFIDPVTGAAPSAGVLYKAIPYSVAAGENMPFWADINVPRDAVPGAYTGTYTVQTAAGEVTGQISLMVWNFELPTTSNLYTSFGIRGEGGDNKPGEYNTSHNYKTDVNVQKELLRNRINFESGVNKEDEDELIAMGLKALNMDFWSGTDYGATEMDNPPDVDQIIAEVNKHNQFLMKYNYTADEIEEVYDNPLYHDTFRKALKAWADSLHQAGVKQLVVSKPYSDLLDDADLGGEGKPIVDIFAILNSYYKDSKNVVKEAQDKGAMVWTYPALIQDGYSPKWALDYAPINYRINPGFINQSIGANGLLYWTVNYWTSSPWTSVNGSEDKFSEYVPGEGILIYPGEQAGLIGVAPSIRLKNIRDGINDYDYIEMLKQAGYGEWTLNITKEIATDFEDWNPSPDALEAARITLGNKLSEIQQHQLSSNADLSDLKVDGVTVSEFNTNTLNYSVNVPNSQTFVTVTASAADSKATVAFAGGNNLVVGDNTVMVSVTAEDGETKKVYTIIVKRAASTGGSGNDNGNGNGNGNGNSNVNGNGTSGGVTVTPTDDSKQTMPAGSGGIAKFANNAITIAVPAGASEKELTITVEKILNTSQLVSNKDVLLSPVYEILKNFTGNFSKPITLTFTFDPKMVGANQTASLFYYDEVKKTWVEIGGRVNGDQITAEVDHFTKFAVFTVDKKVEENPESQPEENLEVKFSDIAGHWAEASIKQTAEKGIVSGYTDGTFKPMGEVTRAEFAVMLARMLKLQGNGAALEFTDKESIGEWAKQGIAQAVQAGIVKGYGDGSFRPNANISRTEMVTMIANALGIAKNAKAATTFADDAEIPAWAKAAVAATMEQGIVQGLNGNKFAPNQTATRAEAAVVLNKAHVFANK